MNNRWKIAILFCILCFYIFLTVMESVEYQNAGTSKTANNNTITNQKPLNDTIVVGNKTVNLTSYFSDPKVKAFKELYGINFRGNWDIIAQIGSPIFSKFESLTGIVQVAFVDLISSISEWRAYGISRNITIKMMVIDGRYLDDQLYLLEIDEPIYTAFDKETFKLSIKEKPVNLTGYAKFSEEDAKVCTINLEMDFKDIIQKNNLKYTIKEDAPIELEMTSKDCEFSLKANLTKEKIDREKKTINYSILLTFLAIINLYAIAKMIKQCIDTPTKATQLSLLTVGFIMIWDTYICLAHLYLALSNEALFHFFIMPTFWYFILFSIFEMKLLIIIWRAKYWNSLQTQEQTRRAMANFYLKLYVGMVSILLLFFKFAIENWFILVMSLYLLPQIVHNAMRGGRVEFDTNYMFIVIGLRALLPLYARGCPESILMLRPSVTFCCALLLIVGAQIVIVYHQSTLGSKFFIPSRFLPIQYNYLEDLPEDIESGIEFDDCAVCMNPLHHTPDVSSAPSGHTRIVLNRLKPMQRQIMKTPCNHKFHVGCLVQWMEIKMECPTCRSALPVLE